MVELLLEVSFRTITGTGFGVLQVRVDFKQLCMPSFQP